jgi:hypothetical protein
MQVAKNPGKKWYIIGLTALLQCMTIITGGMAIMA